MNEHVKRWQEADEAARALVEKLKTMRKAGAAVSDTVLEAAESSQTMIAFELNRAISWSREGRIPYYGG